MRMHDKLLTTMWWETLTSSSGHTNTYLTIRKLRERLVSESIDLCTEQPDYYGPPKLYLGLAENKITRYFSSAVMGSLDFTVRWQHYGSTDGGIHYCGHSIEALDDFERLRSAYKFLTNLTRRQAKAQDRYYGPQDSYQFTLSDPRSVYEQLKKDKVAEVGLNRPQYLMSVFVYASELNQEPLTFLTDEQMKEVS